MDDATWAWEKGEGGRDLVLHTLYCTPGTAAVQHRHYTAVKHVSERTRIL
jgi:hypothetical protein